MSSVRETLRRATDALSGTAPTTVGTFLSDSPERDAEILLCHCLDKTRSWLFTWPEHELQAAIQAQFEALLARRLNGEPIAYLTGYRDFWSLQLRVNASTLIPRPDTETLVEWALELSLPADSTVLDLGTGTGAIALALASEQPSWLVTGVDVSTEAVALATDNAALNQLQRVTFTQSNWFSAVAQQQFNLIVSNPPYIEANDVHLEQGDVRFEPRSALVAAEQGLADLRHIIQTALPYLTDGGWLLLEHGYDQSEAVQALLLENGFTEVANRRDLGGQPRVSGGRKL